MVVYQPAFLQVLGEKAQSSRLLLCEATRKALDCLELFHHAHMVKSGLNCKSTQLPELSSLWCNRFVLFLGFAHWRRKVLLKSFELLGFTPLDKI